MQAMQEEAEKYALHEVNDFVQSIVRTGKSFKEHYEGLDFDRLFFESMLYTNQEVASAFSERRLSLFGRTSDEKALTALLKKEETCFLNTLAQAFKEYFSAIYITEVQQALDDCVEEITWAKEDIVYHKTRAYLQDHAFIGDVSEEERTECIAEGEEKVGFLREKQQQLQTIQRELEQLFIKS